MTNLNAPINSGPKQYRGSQSLWGSRVFAAGMPVIWFMLLIGGWSDWVLPALGLPIWIYSLVAIQPSRSSVVVHDRTLEVRNPLRHTEIEIAGMRIEDTPQLAFSKHGGIVLIGADGTRTKCFGLGKGWTGLDSAALVEFKKEMIRRRVPTPPPIEWSPT